MSIVPQSFKEPIAQLRHKSILKIMSLNCNSIKSISDQSPINDKNDRPIESTPRSLTNINDIEPIDEFGATNFGLLESKIWRKVLMDK